MLLLQSKHWLTSPAYSLIVSSVPWQLDPHSRYDTSCVPVPGILHHNTGREKSAFPESIQAFTPSVYNAFNTCPWSSSFICCCTIFNLSDPQLAAYVVHPMHVTTGQLASLYWIVRRITFEQQIVISITDELLWWGLSGLTGPYRQTRRMSSVDMCSMRKCRWRQRLILSWRGIAKIGEESLSNIQASQCTSQRVILLIIPDYREETSEVSSDGVRLGQYSTSYRPTSHPAMKHVYMYIVSARRFLGNFS